ncbi:SDR family oxidoreductase [Microbulbifer sp. GL-2]|uniref:SDR family oxidoreductase n=1 Tax=Microbulbifer sp. GL-2 TaxID=2591606 RepID=UPI001161E9F4|nr:SDR family oxidoreductase [Microbulbifer sp. GL-2]BBM03592.1 short-chain dehydrogenase [Microbulbifer sp. GL-2]
MSNERIALVTGSNRGIGLEVAKQLSDQGVKVILSGRSQEKLQEVKAAWTGKVAPLDTIELDITKANDRARAAQKIAEQYGRLDILVNNAGVIVEGEWAQNNSETISQDDLQTTFDINLFAQIGLTQELLPLLKKSKAARIVNVSSILGSLAVNADAESGWSAVKPFAYNASKAALNMFTVSLSQSLAETGIKVNSAHPGWVKTDLGTSAAPMEVTDGASTVVDLALIDNDGPNGQFVHLGEAQPW